jgi:hypothetical protein
MALTKINASVIANNTIAVGNIADNSVDATKIASNSILTRHIDDDQITGDQLADNISIAGDFTVDTDTFFVDASQNNVGIGLNTPTAAADLHIKTSVDNSLTQGLVIERSANTDRGYINYQGGAFQIRSTVGDPIAFGETDAEHMRVQPDGNIGIGTTSPAFRLHVLDTIGTRTLSLGHGVSSGTITTDSAKALNFQQAGTTKMTLDSSGNVGIGTTSPNNYSGFTTLTLDGTSGSLIDLEVNGTVTGEVYADASNGAGMQAIGSRRIQFKTNNIERMQIDSSGNVGIGTASPSQTLDVNGTVELNNLTVGGAQGSDGQLLTSTGSGVAWEDAPAGGPTFKTFGTSSIMIGDSTTGTIDAADGNTGLGVDVFEALTSGDNNIAIGYGSLKAATTGHSNVAIGKDAVSGVTDGKENVAVGFETLMGASSVSERPKANVAIGYRAGKGTTDGRHNTFVGFDAGIDNTTGIGNVSVGALSYEGTTGSGNTAMGMYALSGVVTGTYNVGVGYHALSDITSGNYNVAMGNQALKTMTTGSSGVAVGWKAGYYMTVGKTVAVGSEAYYSGTSTDDSVFIGNQAGYNVTTGYTNVIIGDRAGDTSLTTGYSNVIIGYKAGRSTNGFANTFVGSGSGTSTTGAYNTCIGNGANMANANNGGIAIGYAAAPGAAGTYATLAYGGNKSWISLGATGWSGSSDERLKENIRPSQAGLAFINDLKPVNFDWRKKKDIDPELETHVEDLEERYERDNPIGKIGFIAQDVKEALDNHPEVISHLWEEQEDGTQALTPNELIPMLVKAVQELSAKVEELQNG